MSTSDQQEQSLANEYKEHLQRLQAEFENYQKQTQKHLKFIQEETKKQTLKEILEIVDNLERALKHTDDIKTLTEGLKLTHKQTLNKLKKLGVKQLKDEGKQFDITLHEVVAQTTSNKKPGTIIEVMETGYTLDGKPLRHSKVIIAKEEEQ